jgi:hypothetical protein
METIMTAFARKAAGLAAGTLLLGAGLTFTSAPQAQAYSCTFSHSHYVTNNASCSKGDRHYVTYNSNGYKTAYGAIAYSNGRSSVNQCYVNETGWGTLVYS